MASVRKFSISGDMPCWVIQNIKRDRTAFEIANQCYSSAWNILYKWAWCHMLSI